MKLRSTAIALGVGAATAAGLSLLKVDKPVVIGSTSVVIGAGLILLKEENEKEELSSNELVESGQKKCEEGDYKDAINDLTKAIEIDPKNYQAFKWRGVTHQKLCNFKESYDDLAKAIDIEPFVSIPGTAGNVNEILKFTQYIENYKGGTVEDDGFDYTYGELIDNRGVLKSAFKDVEGAIEDYTKAIEIYIESNTMTGSNPYIYYRRAELLANLGKYQKAIEDIDNAIVYDTSPIDIDLHNYYYFRATFKYEIKDYKGAIDDFTKALDIFEYYDYKYLTYINRGISKLDSNDLKGACEDWKKAAELGNEYAAELLKEHCGG